MSTITIQEAAEQLKVGVSSVLTYLAQGKLTGDAKAGLIDVASIEARTDKLLCKRVKHMDAILKALESDDLSKQERSVLTMRSEGAIYDDIALMHDISWQGAQLIVTRALKRLEQARTEP